MKKKLSDDDRRAVDFFLNHTHVATDEGGRVYASPAQSSPQRAKSVERVLALLEAMPAIEPSADLVSRTMRRVEEALASGQGTFNAAVSAARPNL